MTPCVSPDPQRLTANALSSRRVNRSMWARPRKLINRKADPTGETIILEGRNRLRQAFMDYCQDREMALRPKAESYPADCSARRSIESIRAIADGLNLRVFKGRVKASVIYEPARAYKVGYTKAHYLVRFNAPKGWIGVREYCGLPCFPEEILRTAIYLALLTAYSAQSVPGHKLFRERDPMRREKFLRWYADLVAKGDFYLGKGSLAHYEQFRRGFAQWALENFVPRGRAPALIPAASALPQGQAVPPA